MVYILIFEAHVSCPKAKERKNGSCIADRCPACLRPIPQANRICSLGILLHAVEVVKEFRLVMHIQNLLRLPVENVLEDEIKLLKNQPMLEVTSSQVYVATLFLQPTHAYDL